MAVAPDQPRPLRRPWENDRAAARRATHRVAPTRWTGFPASTRYVTVQRSGHSLEVSGGA